jgi:hypothetical protein
MQEMESALVPFSAGKEARTAIEKNILERKTICRKRHMIMITCLRQ